VGEVGIDRHEFLYELKLWEINAIVEGYRRRAHTTWEAARWQTFCIVCAMGAKSFNSPQDLQKFSWEEEQYEELSEDEVKELQDEIDAINSMHNEEDNGDNSSLL